MMAGTCHSSHVKDENRRIAVSAGLGKNVRPYWKNIAKRARGGSSGRVLA
jgi:hypothetical protein